MHGAELTWQVDDKVINDLVVTRQLGQGAFGVVVEARHEVLGELYALKRMKARSPEAAARLLEELNVWLELPLHPSLTTLYFAKTVRDEIVLFMQIFSTSVLSLMERGPDLSKALSIGIQIARALRIVHGAGVVHQDLKPSNFLWNPDETVALTDFGLARSLTDGHTEACGGSPRYRAPEQHAGAIIGSAVDVWALGASLVELLFPQVSWQTPKELATRVVSLRRAEAYDRSDKRVPAQLIDLLSSCLSLTPRERPSAAELLQGFEAVYEAVEGRRYPVQDVAPRYRDEIDYHPERYLEWHERLRQLNSGWPQLGAQRSLRAAAVRDLYALQSLHDIMSVEGVGSSSRSSETIALSKAKAEICEALGDRPGQYAALARAAAEAHAAWTENKTGASTQELAQVVVLIAHASVRDHKLERGLELIRFAMALTRDGIVEHGWEAELTIPALDALGMEPAILRSLGRIDEALRRFDKAAAGMRALQERARSSAANERVLIVYRIPLSSLLVNHASLLDDQGNSEKAVCLYEEALSIQEELRLSPARIANTRLNYAIALQKCKRIEEARQLVERVVADLRAENAEDARGALEFALQVLGELASDPGLTHEAARLAEQRVRIDGQFEALLEMARAKGVQARALADGDPAAALPVYDAAIALFERVADSGNVQAREQLAAAYGNKSVAMARAYGKSMEAASVYEKAIALYETLVHTDGQAHVACELAAAYHRHANMVNELVDAETNLHLRMRAAEASREVAGDRHRDHAAYAICDYGGAAMALIHLDRIEEALQAFDKAEDFATRSELTPRAEYFRAVCLDKRAGCQILRGDGDQAYKHYRQSLDILSGLDESAASDLEGARLETFRAAVAGLRMIRRFGLAAELLDDYPELLTKSGAAQHWQSSTRDESVDLEALAPALFEANQVLFALQLLPWHEKQALLTKHADLLLDPTIHRVCFAILGRIVDEHAAEIREYMSRMARFHHELLQRCMARGIKTTFADKQLSVRFDSLRP